MIVRPHLEYASICWKPYTKHSIEKVEAVHFSAAKFVLNFYDLHPTADLCGKIQKSLQWNSLLHHRVVPDVCMLNKLRNNLADIAITPMLVPSVKHDCHYNYIQSLILILLNTNYFLEVSDFGIPFFTIWQLNHVLGNFALQPSSGSHLCSGTSIPAQILGAWLKILLSFLVAIIFCL